MCFIAPPCDIVISGGIGGGIGDGIGEGTGIGIGIVLAVPFISANILGFK